METKGKIRTQVLTPNCEEVRSIVATIVATVHPLRILVFGSVARGTTGPNSDLDLLVIMPNGTHRRRTAHSILRALTGCGIGKDIIVATADDIEKYRHDPNRVIEPALRDGKELYRAA